MNGKTTFFIFSFLLMYLLTNSQNWKNEIIKKELIIANSNDSINYEIDTIKKEKNKWIVYYKIGKYYCYFCEEYNCPFEKCRRKKGVMFKKIDDSTLQVVYIGNNHPSEWELLGCSLYEKDDRRIKKAKHYKIIY